MQIVRRVLEWPFGRCSIGSLRDQAGSRNDGSTAAGRRAGLQRKHDTISELLDFLGKVALVPSSTRGFGDALSRATIAHRPTAIVNKRQTLMGGPFLNLGKMIGQAGAQLGTVVLVFGTLEEFVEAENLTFAAA